MADGESRGFEGWRQRGGLLLAPLAFALVWLLPFALEPRAHRLAAILAAVVILWVTEAIPMVITAFVGVAAAVVLQVAPAREAFAPFADPLIFLFIGTFLLAQAIFFHGLDRRFAFAILALPGVGARPARVLAAYAGAACAISMWISNTATTAMMFPIGVSLLAALEAHAGRLAAYGTALLLSTSFAASIGGLGTPVGTPPNLIGIGFVRREVGVELPFFVWMALGVPVVVCLFLFMVAGFRAATREGGRYEAAIDDVIAAERAALGPWTRGQVNAMVAFGVTVFFWVLPGVVALTAGTAHPTYRILNAVLPEGVVAVFGAALLFVLPVDGRSHRFTLPWEEAVKIDWWIVFLYGGGIALGTLAFETGLAEALGRGLTDLLGVHSALGLIALSTALATVLSETTSNTASANMVVPVVIAFARSAGIDPVLPAVGATMGASLGFMLPVSTPCNAIVYGSGRIPLPAMMRYGLALDVVGVVVIIAVVAGLGPVILPAGGETPRGELLLSLGSMQEQVARKRVLLVEDDRDVREALMQVLEFEGYEVASAENGLEAIERLRQHALPSVILLDLMMPVMDGRQFRAAQLQDPTLAGIPVIVISADGQVEQKIASLGIAAYLRKPIEVEDLLELIGRYC